MNFYFLYKSLHLISVISWMAGLLYLPRIFVYHTQAKSEETLEITVAIRMIRNNGLDAVTNRVKDTQVRVSRLQITLEVTLNSCVASSNVRSVMQIIFIIEI